ncbi:copine-8-like [Pollicipes pollicipes]|uniref:copine-8-like n=1 Tax=Pollicipes pollicipes TaxID=41117 RepID=UPI001884DB78|nr:copine-8-like [Pollicipes pollicipes]XP_037075272.1 copine-8-like [Pollicipes pollicipes]XP_037075273.1 copine-8-like [Pollicipes pollicipes]XP_037075274.1 copine-8-like [Pollicipes pollicipes]
MTAPPAPGVLHPGAFRPGAVALPSSLVEVSICCSGLRDLDIMSKSDPCCILYLAEGMATQFFEVGRTEVIKNNLNPEFATKFQISYKFEEKQRLKFDIYDWDVKVASVQEQDFLGRVECTVGELVSAPNRKFQRKLSESSGVLSVTAEELAACREVLTLSLSARKVDKKDFFSKSDPFLAISRVNEDNSYTVVHRTEVVKRSLNPDWRSFTVPLVKLCNGDKQRSLRLECLDWDNDGSHDSIGACHANVARLVQPASAAAPNTYALINERKKAKKRRYKDSGTLVVNSARLTVQATFLDYIQGGLQLHFTVAVDFTASNGNPADPRSLHYRDPRGADNQYVTAIRAVGDIIQDYDSDKMFPCLGFGARVPPTGQVSHEFFLNGHPTDPYCRGVDGVLQAYYNALNTVQLYGPTCFAPAIRHVARFASTCEPGKHYFVLLIITDGIITDQPDTVAALVDASALPMSVIIVGVGSEDFSAMEYLDADNQRLRDSRGRAAARDIVQFVELQRATGQHAPGPAAQAALADLVLTELPGQVVSYMAQHGKTAPPAAT